MSRTCRALVMPVIALLAAAGSRLDAQTSPSTFKIAYYNIQSGKGEQPLPGHSCVFTENTNCTDPSKPLNAWGKGIVQAELKAKLANDIAVVALGLSEAWSCASPAAVQQVLGWAARSSSKNGVAIIARYGFAGSEQWLQLDTSGNESPADTMWVLKIPVCLDAACSKSVLTFTAHWFGKTAIDADSYTVYERQAEQTIEFLDSVPNQPRVLIGDLNVFEATEIRCSQFPLNKPIQMLRDAGYLDAWNAVHAQADGNTGMWNRPGCGTPEGALWKRLDFAWSQKLAPVTMSRFGMVEPGECAPSDHAGIVVEYPHPSALASTVPPQVSLQSPGANQTVSGNVVIEAAAIDDKGVRRVELLIDGVARHVAASAPYRFTWDSRSAVNGMHTIEAAATDLEGNRVVSAVRTVFVDNKGGAGDEIVLYARDASAIKGNWSLVTMTSAAGGRALYNTELGLSRVSTARTSPGDYVELTFTANAGKPYRLWLRGQADGNSVDNDSVHVQFSGSVSSTGSPVYRIGSSSSTVVSLEDCGGCGLSGWGWQDNASGGRDVLGPTVYFASSGPQTIRLQRREDGIRFDQIVLSAVAYLHAAPGQTVNDSTILPANNGGTAPPPDPPPSATQEVVLYAGQPAVVQGNWSVVNDATAAGGTRLQNPNAGAAKLTTALAAPSHYFELTFNAVAGTPYRLWIRGKAINNHYANDSVFVQFDKSVDSAGKARWRIGTSSATTFVLEECGGCAMNGWGWEDNGYGAGVLGPEVYFAETGAQRVRIQVREDGLGIDQVVLSPAKYLTSPPGPPRADATIVPASGGTSSPPPDSSSGEVVLYAGDAPVVQGGWRRETDSSAAGGARLRHPNAGAAKKSMALASPVDYFEMTFQAQAGIPYHIWIRGKADNDHWANDSVFVQFSGETTYGIGTTSAVDVNLEDCSGCKLSGWGWQDNGWGVGVMGPDITFSSGGLKTIRVQTREDGFSIDQIVLSPGTYLTTSPGALKNDTTILPKQ